jgi:hypothetical protein
VHRQQAVIDVRGHHQFLPDHEQGDDAECALGGGPFHVQQAATRQGAHVRYHPHQARVGVVQHRPVALAQLIHADHARATEQVEIEQVGVGHAENVVAHL